LKSAFVQNGVDTDKWINIKHGYNPKGSRKRKKDTFYRFAFTGTLQRNKGAHLVLEAFIKIQDPKVRLAIYGEAKHDLAYSSYCMQLSKGDDRIEFRGRYDHTKINEEFADIDCIIVPSNWFEPFPFTLISAVAYGFDVIGSKIGGIPEIIGEANSSSLFDPGDIKDLQEKMINKSRERKQKDKPIFYEQNLESEGFKYFQVYNLTSGKNL